MHCYRSLEAFTTQLSAMRRCTLPHLEELELASTTLLPPNGDRLLRQLVSGAAGSLRRLDLHSSAFGGDLSMLAAASGLTWLNLAGEHVGGEALLACSHNEGCACSKVVLVLGTVLVRHRPADHLPWLACPQAHVWLTGTWPTSPRCRSAGCPWLTRRWGTRACRSCWPCRSVN